LPPRLTAAGGAFHIDGRPRFLLSGEMHYFRVAPDRWRESLRRIRALGVRGISTYVPWVWHEPEEGRFDFTGATHPGRDLGGFLTACRELDLFVLARPGPLIYAEYQGLGVPLWLGTRHPETVVVRRDGSLDRGDFYFNHSLMHPTYCAYVRRWYEAVVPALRPFFDDPIVTFQLDNETGLLFSNRIGEIDFNADTVDRYRRYLKTIYGDLRSLNTSWETRYASFERIQPPKPPLRQPAIHDWQAFLEALICEHLMWLGDQARELGVTVPLTHNEQGMHHSPAHACEKEPLVDFQGYDIYPKASPGRHTLDFPFATSFYPALFTSYAGPDRPLWATEVGMGWLDSRAWVSEEAIVQNVMGSLAHGARGLNLFPIQDGREPIEGSSYTFQTALDADGRYQPRARTIEELARFIEKHGERLAACREVRDPVAFGAYYPNFHFNAEEYLRHTIFLDPHRYLAFLGQGGVHGTLLCAGFNPAIIDVGEDSAEEALAAARCLVWTNKGLLDEHTFARLERWVMAGGHLVTAPVPPQRDLRGHAMRFASLFPIAPSSVRPLDRVRAIASMGLGLLRFWLFHRARLRAEHLSSGHVIELYEPLLHLLMTPAHGERLAHPWGEPVRGDYLSARFNLLKRDGFDPQGGPMAARGPLRRPGASFGAAASYRIEVGSGTSTVLGSLVGGRYVTPRYYSTPAESRRAMRDFVRGLLAERGVEPAISTDLEAEFVAHKAPDGGGYLFVINRLDEHRGRLRVLRPAEWGYRGRLRVAYSLLGSAAAAHGADEMDLHLMRQDVLVLEFPPA
jgi:beta-galactosidase